MVLDGEASGAAASAVTAPMMGTDVVSASKRKFEELSAAADIHTTATAVTAPQGEMSFGYSGTGAGAGAGAGTGAGTGAGGASVAGGGDDDEDEDDLPDIDLS
jgi:hypothetical protein